MLYQVKQVGEILKHATQFYVWVKDEGALLLLPILDQLAIKEKI